MDQSEKIAQIKALQQKIKDNQSTLEETTLSDDGELRIIMDGHLQITELYWLQMPEDESDQTRVLVKTINKAITNTNARLQEIMKQLAASMNLPVG